MEKEVVKNVAIELTLPQNMRKGHPEPHIPAYGCIYATTERATYLAVPLWYLMSRKHIPRKADGCAALSSYVQDKLG